MTPKERIEEMIYSSIRRATRHCPNCNQEFLYEQSVDVPQATSDILKVIREDRDPSTLRIALEERQLKQLADYIIDDMKERIG